MKKNKPMGKVIKQIRKLRKITQAELAARSNLAQTSISQIETGIKKPQGESLKAIAKVLKVKPEVLIILTMIASPIPRGSNADKELMFRKKLTEAVNVMNPTLTTLSF